MKKVFVLLIFLIGISFVSFVLITKADTIKQDEALKIGEEKYLKFLWMVDGAFNNDRFKEEFIVNDRKISKEDKVFSCNYKNNECIGVNFEIEFSKLFSHNISFDKVYSNGTTYSWLNIKNGVFLFNNTNTCSINRMGVRHKLSVIEINDNKIIYEVKFNNRQTNQEIIRNFELVFENNIWKINYAFYYDLCGMWYTIH